MSKTARELFEAATGGEWTKHSGTSRFFIKSHDRYIVSGIDDCGGEVDAALICRMHKAFIPLVEALEEALLCRGCTDPDCLDCERGTPSLMSKALAIANGEDEE